jgi:hypothetical protein
MSADFLQNFHWGFPGSRDSTPPRPASQVSSLSGKAWVCSMRNLCVTDSQSGRAAREDPGFAMIEALRKLMGTLSGWNPFAAEARKAAVSKGK